MYLKKIKIQGFKSFADVTVLDFHPGITAIAGPNGCGKSNISDSFRWVLGEQSAKSMRGNKMNDVIFAGTAKRKPLNLAEVTITLGDVGERLKTDYDEVAVTRRIHRSGESDYLINKRSARLRDVHDLFMDSGMGKNAFSIFEQGKIEQVIQLSPLERRYIFEEAAGILRFLQRKKEALRRLEQTENNIDRVRDIHQEVEKQIIVLEKQAEQAKIYKENRLKLEELEISLAAARWTHFNSRCAYFSEKEAAKKQELDALALLLEKRDVARQDANIRLNHTAKELQTQKEEVFKTRSQKEIQAKAWKSQEERFDEMAHKEDEWRQELDKMGEKRRERHLEARTVEDRQKEVEAEFSQLTEAKENFRDQLGVIEHEVSAIRDRQHTAQQDRMHALQAENKMESELKQAALKWEHHQERILRLQENQQAARSRQQALAEQISAKQSESVQSAACLAELKEELSLLEDQIEEKSTSIKEIQQQLSQNSQELAEIKARRNALFRLRAEMDGFSKGAKKIMQESAKSASPLFGKVRGLYEDFPAEGCDPLAISIVMKRYTETLLVGTLDDFNAVVSYARENQVRDFSLICLEMLPQVQKATDGDAFALKMVDHPLINFFLQDVVVKESTKELWHAAGKEVWTADGAYIDKYRVVFFPSEGEGNAFVREAELKSLDKKLTACEQKKAALEEALHLLSEQLSVSKGRRQEADQVIRRAEVKHVELTYALERMEVDRKNFSLEMEKEQVEVQALQESGSRLQIVMDELRARHTEQRKKLEEHKMQVETLDSTLQVKLEQFKLQQVEMGQKESAYQKAAEEKRRIVHQLNVLEATDRESLLQEKRLEEEIQSLQEKRSGIQLNRVDYQQKMEEIEQRLRITLKRCTALETAVQACQTDVQDLEKELGEKREEIRRLEKELHELEMQRMQFDSSRQALESEFTERFQMSMREAQAQAKELEGPMEKAERKIRSLRRQVEEAEGINMTSIEEYEKCKERDQFFSQQIDDLTASKQELVEIITRLDGESRKIFKETFNQIQANFRKNFEVLFRGGEADLQFTESGDILEAGIDIVAKPPGKKMRSISLLSGGEKCLTAVALLFAIFEVKPAPFCILDEIDAPLDDTNVERFLNVVKQFTDRCQFIIITHNKRTMAIADRIFGVSMQERGVSKILSLEFDRREAREPELIGAI